MPDVFELTRGYQHIEQGNPLIFPNVLTCMAFIAYDGATLIGVHFTVADQSTARISGAWMRVQAISAGAHRVYVAGPSWNASLLANLVPAPASFSGVVSLRQRHLGQPGPRSGYAHLPRPRRRRCVAAIGVIARSF